MIMIDNLYFFIYLLTMSRSESSFDFDVDVPYETGFFVVVVVIKVEFLNDLFYLKMIDFYSKHALEDISPNLRVNCTFFVLQFVRQSCKSLLEIILNENMFFLYTLKLKPVFNA
jgi:hypothetical protein